MWVFLEWFKFEHEYHSNEFLLDKKKPGHFWAINILTIVVVVAVIMTIQ